MLRPGIYNGRENKLGLIFFVSFILGGFLPVFSQVPLFIPKAGVIADAPDIGNFYGHGASAADFDNDGDIDFYLCTMNGQNNRLYQNNGFGEFDEVAVSLGVNNRGSSRMALWMDYNADSRLDLFVLVERCANFKCGQPILLYLYEQQASGQFIEKGAVAGLDFGDKYDNIEVYSAGGMAAADVNNDEYPDLLVTVWGGKMTLFTNNGDGTFTDSSESSGLGLEAHYYWQPMFHDFDHDGKIDLFNNVDFGPNQFWKNNGGSHFTEIAGQIGAMVDNSEMGMALGDFDNDGDLDAYLTNISQILLGGIMEHNVFLINDSEAGFLVFNEKAELYGIDKSGWDWGTTFLDINNDGWLDLATTNGWNNDPLWGADQSHLWLNINGAFTDVSEQTGFNDLYSATSLIGFDMDRDGDLDMLQTLKDNETTMEPAILYENTLQRSTSGNNYLSIRPRMDGPNKFALGAVVRIKTGDLNMMRLISAGTSFYGQEPAEAFFGLGKESEVDEITIEWPDGKSSIYNGVPVNQVITLNNELINEPLLQVAEITNEGILIEWSDESDNETGFILQRSPTNSFEEVTEIKIEKDVTSYLDRISDITTAYYRIKAIKNYASSPYSAVKRVSLITSTESESNNTGIYPNPTDGKIIFKTGTDFTGYIDIFLFDQAGRQVFYQLLQKDSPYYESSVEMPVGAGVYHLQIRMGRQLIQKRLIITGGNQF